MGKRMPHTPSSTIRTALRRLWLRSRERAAAMKLAGYCCHECGRKQSRAKGREVYVQVHHVDGIDWDGLLALIRARLLHEPERLQVLCKECHKQKHAEEDA